MGGIIEIQNPYEEHDFGDSVMLSLDDGEKDGSKS